MRTANEIVSKLKERQSSSPSKWRKNAEWRMANKSWLRYSQHIAMIMLDKMDELGMTQKHLSELRVSGFFRLVTPYVRNKVLPACT